MRKFTGLLLIIIGLFCNKSILEKILYPHLIFLLDRIIPFCFISIFFILAGLIIFFFKKEWLTVSYLSAELKFISITTFLGILIFISFNMIFYAYYKVKDLTYQKDYFQFNYLKKAVPLYRSLTKRQVSELLSEMLQQQIHYSSYVQFKYAPQKGKYINISKNGYRLVENQCPFPLEPKNLNIFIFGGSTTFGEALPDHESIPSYLQKCISKNHPDKKVCVYNYGRPLYYSTQEQVLFLKRIRENLIPDIAIFIDGLNEFVNGYDEPVFSQELALLTEVLAEDKIPLFSLPLLQFTDEVLIKIKDLLKYKILKKVPSGKNDKKSFFRERIEKYKRNKAIIESVSKTFKVKPIFIWQPVPFYKYDLKHHLFPDKEDIIENYETFNCGYKYFEDYTKQHYLGKNFLYLGNIQENIKNPLYIDSIHYSPEMSEIIAKKIYDFLVQERAF